MASEPRGVRGLALLLSGGFVLSGRFLIMDSLLTLCTTVCLLAGYLAIRQSTFRWQWWALSSIACGFGILTKGPLAVLLCVPPMLVHQWLTNQRLSDGQTRIQFRHLAAFFVPVLLMTLPWFVAVSMRNSEFSAHFFWEHNVVRFTRAFNHHQPWWFYIPILFAGMFPTSLLLPSLGVFLFGRANANRRFRTPDMGYLLIGSAWVLLFFSCSACKLPTYILPAIPLLCLLTGAMLDHTVLKPDLVNAVTSFLKPFPQRATAIMLLTCVVVAFIDAVIMSGNHSVALVAFAIVLFTAVLTGMTWKKEIASSKLGWSFTVVVAIAVSVFAFGEFVPSISVSRSVLRRVASLHEQNERLPIVFFAEDSYAASMYVPDKQLVRYGKQEREAFAVFMASHPDAIVVTKPELAESAQDSVRSSCDLIARGGRRRVFLATSANTPSTRLANANDEKFD